jgi:PAS domain S-box-containing protein
MNYSKELFSFLFENLPNASSYSSLSNGKIINCNRSWLDLYEFKSKDEVIGKTAKELNILALENQRERMVKMVKEHTIIKNIERPMRTNKGNNIWVSTSALVINMDHIEVILFVTIDITKRKEAEDALGKLYKELEQKVIDQTEELRKSEWGLKRAQEISHIGNWEVDFINNKSSWSDEVYKILGFEKGEVKPTLESYLKTFHPDDIERCSEIIQNSFKNKTNIFFDHRSFRKDGMLIYLYSESRFLFDKDGKPISVYGITQDVTEIVERENKLLIQNKALKDIATMQSHQVRKPVAQILGLVNLLNKDNPADPLNAEILDKLYESASSFDNIIREISKMTDDITNLEKQ